MVGRAYIYVEAGDGNIEVSFGYEQDLALHAHKCGWREHLVFTIIFYPIRYRLGGDDAPLDINSQVRAAGMVDLAISVGATTPTF